ncbi:MAG: SUF system Fe-S cluster assembly protein [Acidobacteria bacterium]|nr:MAG: SUF system Fe-S cluster assembly protein [Acidobacteriota bacterium]
MSLEKRPAGEESADRPSAADSPAPAERQGGTPPDAPAGGGSADDLKTRIVEALKSIHDPEIPVNIYDMGLVYGIDIDDGHVTVRMTLTSPACPVAQSLPLEVEMKIGAIEGVRSARVDVVWDPPWTPDRMSEEARLELGFF